MSSSQPVLDADVVGLAWAALIDESWSRSGMHGQTKHTSLSDAYFLTVAPAMHIIEGA